MIYIAQEIMCLLGRSPNLRPLRLTNNNIVRYDTHSCHVDKFAPETGMLLHPKVAILRENFACDAFRAEWPPGAVSN